MVNKLNLDESCKPVFIRNDGDQFIISSGLGLNSTSEIGARIMLGINNGFSILEIKNELLETYDVEEKDLCLDMIDFLISLNELQIISDNKAKFYINELRLV